MMQTIKRMAFGALMLFLAFALCACGVNVTFDIGDATLVSGETLQVYQEDSPVLPPVLEKEGYAFAGWDSDFSAPTEDMTVSPLWKKIHTVTFDPQGGVFEEGAASALEVVDGEAATAPVVSKEKYDFVKWDAELSAVTGDMTVNAVWQRKSFTSTEIFNLVNPATVEIKTYRKNNVYYAMGSGFFINEDGLLVTNYHVIADARSFRVILSDKTEYEVTKVVGYDIEKDIALLQVDTKGSKMPFLEVGTELPTVGDAVYAIGSSLGLTGTFSSGIVSFVNREIDGVKFIQTTTPISQGNSGGPLVDEHGYVVGINSASYTEGQNLNLSVEISQYLSVAKCDMTPEALFQKEGTVEWYFGENIVDEDQDICYDRGQILPNGATVRSTLISGFDEDYYMVAAPNEAFVLLAMVRADTEEALTKLATYGLVFYTATDSVQDAYTYPENLTFAQIADDGDGTTYLVVSVAVPAEYATLMQYIGLGFYAEQRTEYDLFLYTMTDIESYLGS